MNDLVTRLLALAEKAVDEALQFDYGDPEDRYIYRELQELKQLVQNQPNDLSHLSEQEFNALAPQGYHATGPADSELEWPTDEELLESAAKALAYKSIPSDEACLTTEAGELVAYARAVLARWGRPAIEPVPVSERMPGPEDCAQWPDDPNAPHWAWFARYFNGGWEWSQHWALGIDSQTLIDATYAGGGWTHWLPYNALPLPTK